MNAYLQMLCAQAANPLLARHLVREYLQARILRGLQRAGAMQALAFHGGTALRFLYDTPRYSEDLDFALENPAAGYDFRAFLHQIENGFAAETYTLDLKVSDKGIVHKAFVRFRGLLYELGLSAHRTEVLAVKLEVDTNPPSGAQLTTTEVERHVRLQIQHHDPATLLSGKLHAVLQRSYPKGRDFYDLWWYLQQHDWPEPNVVHLNHALAQSGWSGPMVDAANWRHLVRQRIVQLDWEEDVLRDVRAFIFSPEWEAQLTRDAMLGLL